ncbi:MAG: transcription antitermination factor NusB [Elusimicrobia bacterium GWC2_51_8]|nr:MAG: transcription antitermination factor NusB [Elusimicrobia bacterium GWA2_51_34]OGR58905.1 MAG: transcription antitermination factor NusB [Elusimicrobia bacterium GWC2_51_8]OGR87239.1 MAG: transcription antitermination factor NusB [Elusimicrobia bacterium GWF2_52_66]HAF95503.1 transcription antitermination factor NusB [Elusimicrobiota bacterium]HCE98333.1 transcription antitermination factor NusB [Elusimicrobiota bacterium]
MSKRRLARENCLQSLYVTDIGAYGSDSVLASFQMTDFALEGKTFDFYKELFFAAVSNLEKIDSIIRSTSTNWDMGRMSATDRAILRMAVCEMMILRDAPAAVIIDEAIELAKKYSTENSGKFVNGVLDSVAKNNNLMKGPSGIFPQYPLSAGIGGEDLTARAGPALLPTELKIIGQKGGAGGAKARAVKTAHRRRSAADPVAGKARRKSRPPVGPKADPKKSDKTDFL